MLSSKTDQCDGRRLVAAAACDSIIAASEAMRTRTTSAAELLTACLERVDAFEDTLHTFVTVTPERARSDAQRADAELARGVHRGFLHGIPYGLKDNLDTYGIRTSCNSRLLWQNTPNSDSDVAARMDAAGGVLIGKLSMDEFALGGRNATLPCPPACNPWNIGHETGGSSSGSAAAVAAGLLPVAIGSDTGGSTRIPAAYCGVVGLKPTYGLVAREGMYPLSPTLDHCGLLVRNVRDAAAVLPILTGGDRSNGPRMMSASTYLSCIERGPAGLRVGLLRGFFDDQRQSPELTSAIDAITHALASMGARISPIAEDQCPEYGTFRSCGAVIMLSEAYTVHKTRLMSQPDRYSKMTLRRLALGATISHDDFLAALTGRRELTKAVDSLLHKFDVLISPTVLQSAPTVSHSLRDFPNSPARAMAFNVTGHPAMSIPVGLAQNGLPLAIQIAARAFDEATMFNVGCAIETASNWRNVAFSTRQPG